MFAFGIILGLFVGLIFGLFKLTIMLGCEITELVVGTAIDNIKKVAEAQPSYRTKEV